MTRSHVSWAVVLCSAACAAEPGRAVVEQAFMQNQGTQLQGLALQGSQLDNMKMIAFQFAGATRNGAPLTNVRVEHGELLASDGATPLEAGDLYDAHLFAVVRNLGANQTALVEYRIAAVEAETQSAYDPTGTGETYLYRLEQSVNGGWQPACQPDADGRRVAIPLTAYFDEHGDRIESTTQFTFGCTTGVIAKCYRWGYKPWLTGFGNMAELHWTCTRVARADYCGNGKPHTKDGTLINLWDNTPAPGPIETQGTAQLGMLFEAGWNTGGAVCLSHARWLLGGPIILLGCPGKLIAPGLGVLGATVCDTPAAVLGLNSGARMFDESFLNLNLDWL